jgi:mannose-6-phosphate isomerase-like protein (cupin superfamily)
MLAWVADIEHATKNNENFRTVLFTGDHMQLTVMRLGPGEDIGPETHPHLDQFLRVEQGTGRVELGRSRYPVEETHEIGDDWAAIIPAGIWHNVINTGEGELKLYSLYSPPEHPEGTVHGTKADAEAAEAAHHERRDAHRAAVAHAPHPGD